MLLLTIDDHGTFRYGLRLTLEQQFPAARILEAATVDDGIGLIRTHGSLDLALVDIALPGGDGIGAIGRLAAAAPGLAIAVLTASEKPADIRGALRAGAMGYVKKSYRPAVLCNVIQLILSGERFFPVIADAANAESSAAAGIRLPFPVDLTPRQTEILRGVADGRSNKEIAQELDIIEGTVKAHVRSLMGKLRARNRTHLAMTAMRLGLVKEVLPGSSARD